MKSATEDSYENCWLDNDDSTNKQTVWMETKDDIWILLNFDFVLAITYYGTFWGAFCFADHLFMRNA